MPDLQHYTLPIAELTEATFEEVCADLERTYQAHVIERLTAMPTLLADPEMRARVAARIDAYLAELRAEADCLP